MSIAFIPTKELTSEQAKVIEDCSKQFEGLGYRNIAGNGYYQWVKDTDEEYKEINIDIYKGSIDYKYWFSMKSKSKKYKPTKVEKDLAIKLQSILEEIVDHSLSLVGFK